MNAVERPPARGSEGESIKGLNWGNHIRPQYWGNRQDHLYHRPGEEGGPRSKVNRVAKRGPRRGEEGKGRGAQ